MGNPGARLSSPTGSSAYSSCFPKSPDHMLGIAKCTLPLKLARWAAKSRRAKWPASQMECGLVRQSPLQMGWGSWVWGPASTAFILHLIGWLLLHWEWDQEVAKAALAAAAPHCPVVRTLGRRCGRYGLKPLWVRGPRARVFQSLGKCPKY